MHTVERQVVEQCQYGATEFGSVSRLQRLARLPVPRQVQGNHPAFGGQGRLIEQPVVQIAPEAVHQHQRRAALAHVQITQQAPAYLDFLCAGAGLFGFGGTGDEPGVEAFDHAIDLSLCRLALHHNSQ
ncbi:hypothetical protein PFLmoz3_00817 [Pseudomonas fluorescens]|uniref:Uncharacterized protein n=1 Tax=Pseudomonas fluorescens TaxID=294 RepID=A0A109LL32_PSEFL|nr:hypothetical protein PFLmoz3_00817 [Pseudomonas fluorescens]